MNPALGFGLARAVPSTRVHNTQPSLTGLGITASNGCWLVKPLGAQLTGESTRSAAAASKRVAR